jgi:hypothetical protein
MSPFGSRSNSIDSNSSGNDVKYNQIKKYPIRREREQTIQNKNIVHIDSSPSPEKFLLKLKIQSYGSSYSG